MDKAGYAENKFKFLKDNILPKLQNLERNIKKGDFINGELSVVDFLAYESIKWIQGVDSNCLD